MAPNEAVIRTWEGEMASNGFGGCGTIRWEQRQHRHWLDQGDLFTYNPLLEALIRNLSRLQAVLECN